MAIFSFPGKGGGGANAAKRTSEQGPWVGTGIATAYEDMMAHFIGEANVYEH